MGKRERLWRKGRITMDRDEAQRWKQIITRDLRLARYALAMRAGEKDYLRARIAENEAILYSLAAYESVERSLDASERRTRPDAA
jgi:hypothetical protein